MIDPDKLWTIRARLEEGLRQRMPQAVLHGALGCVAPHILSVSFPGLRGEVLLHALEEKGIYVGTGSACSSHSHKPSAVLRAMQMPPSVAEGTLRISWGWDTDPAGCDALLDALASCTERLGRYRRR